MAICLSGTLLFYSCGTKYNSGDRLPNTKSSEIDSVSYALGVYFGGMIKNTDFGELNKTQIVKGMDDMISGKELKVAEAEIMQVIQEYLTIRQNLKAEQAEEEGKKFLEEKKLEEGVVTAESGLAYKIIELGEGNFPKGIDTVEVNYKGTLIDGTVFDSSYDRGEPAKFPLDRVIPGWTEGMTYIKEGGKIELYVPSTLGYGPRQAGSIPANSTLIFEVELIKIYPAQEKK